MTELPAKTQEQWCEEHLDVWCSWKHGWSAPRGLPSGSLVLENYTTIDRDSERAYEKLDEWIAQQVDHVIQWMGKTHPTQKAALYRAYNIVNVFIFQRGNYEDVLKEAKRNVLAGLKRRSVWCGE